MASLYKKPISVTDPKTGKKRKGKSKKWWGRYRDENGIERRVPLASDKTAAQAMLNELVLKKERKAAGFDDPFENHRNRPLSEHLKDFKNHLTTKGSTDDYIKSTNQRIKSLIEACKFELISQISPGRVQEFLADLRQAGKSIASSNHYLRAIKMFTRWLVRDCRTKDDRVAHLSRMNVELDRRRIRRPLSMEEFSALLDATEKGPSIQHVSGPERTIIYIVGAYTGYRRNEIGSVTQRSFDFVSNPPTLTVQAGYSKHRRTDILPLRRDFADRIKAWIASKSDLSRDQPLFSITDKRTAEMIRKDLDAARAKWVQEAVSSEDLKQRESSPFLSYMDEHGRCIDFHALRMTFITNLTRSGVAPKTAQMLARHSDINLTMNTYTSLGVMDQASAVETLPPIPTGVSVNQSVSLKATGTDGNSDDTFGKKKVPTTVPRSAENGAKQVASPSFRIASDCTDTGSSDVRARQYTNGENHNENGSFCTTLHEPASVCTGDCESRDLNPDWFPHWILSPARLPIPPLSRAGLATAYG
jgi:integrase